MNILTLNAGSNSLKFEIVATKSGDARPEQGKSFGRSLIAGAYDDIGKPNSSFALWEGKRPVHREQQEVKDHGHATELLTRWLEDGNAASRGIRRLTDLEMVGHRVVHGGDIFKAPAKITDEVIRAIESLEELAPLHNRSALKVIHAAQEKFGSQIPMVAMFDTIFHQTIPDEAALYGLPVDLAERHRIRRYGFHGLSHRYMMLRYAEITRRPSSDLNLITLHLEGGSSVAAIRRGSSVDTSMGFTPLEGLMMGTRCGDIDPTIVLHLMRKEGLDADAVENFLNKRCGLLGVSGISADTRVLRERLAEPRVHLALDIFCYRVVKYIGAYLAVLGGADAIVFGGGIGENTAVVRERICRKLAWCGAILDDEANNAAIDCEARISTPDSAIEIRVIPTEENLMMARDIAEWS